MIIQKFFISHKMRTVTFSIAIASHV